MPYGSSCLDHHNSPPFRDRNGGVKTAAGRTFRRRSAEHHAVKNKRVTAQGPIKKPQMDYMSHRGGGGWLDPSGGWTEDQHDPSARLRPSALMGLPRRIWVHGLHPKGLEVNSAGDKNCGEQQQDYPEPRHDRCSF